VRANEILNPKHQFLSHIKTRITRTCHSRCIEPQAKAGGNLVTIFYVKVM
jgi:hypothetical protein